MNSPYKNPFETKGTQPLPRNYSDVFNPEDYEWKDSIELESYARNLTNYLRQLLQQTPFPAFLFEKLEKRLDGITSILEKRSLASGALDKDKAKERLLALERKITPVAVTRMDSQEKLEPPIKKRRLDPAYVEEVRACKNELDRIKKSYSPPCSQAEMEEEEEN